MRQYFNVVVRARDVVTAIRRDGAFVGTVRRGLRPLPFDRQPAPGPVFGPLRGAVPPPLTGRVGVVATGGSGALASLVGVAKALQDGGTEVSVYSVCSGLALFGFPLGAGMPPDEVAELTASMRPGDYIDVGWREIAALIPTLARGWCGILRGDKLEAFYRRHLGDLTLARLRTPAYAPIWNVEHNRLDYVGPRTHPDMPVARPDGEPAGDREMTQITVHGRCYDLDLGWLRPASSMRMRRPAVRRAPLRGLEIPVAGNAAANAGTADLERASEAQDERAAGLTGDPCPERTLICPRMVASHLPSAGRAWCSRIFLACIGTIRRAASSPVSGRTEAKYSRRRSSRDAFGEPLMPS